MRILKREAIEGGALILIIVLFWSSSPSFALDSELVAVWRYYACLEKVFHTDATIDEQQIGIEPIV